VDWLRHVLHEARHAHLGWSGPDGTTFADAAAEWFRYSEHDRGRKLASPGARSLERPIENAGAADVTLTQPDLDAIQDALPNGSSETAHTYFGEITFRGKHTGDRRMPLVETLLRTATVSHVRCDDWQDEARAG
jgi:hypothetical protein